MADGSSQPRNTQRYIDDRGGGLAQESATGYFEEEAIDYIDETTVVGYSGFGVLTGEKISHMTSPTAVGTIDKSQMTTFTDSSGFQVTEYGWPSESDVPPWARSLFTDFYTGATFGVMLAEAQADMAYVDGDKGVFDFRTNISVYGHMTPVPIGTLNRPVDPQVNSAEGNLITGADGEYGSAVYKSPFDYDPLEAVSLWLKYGYDATTYSSNVYDGTYQRMQAELQDALEMLQLGYTERQNIRRITQKVDVFRDFEMIEEPELQEDPFLAQEMTFSTDPTMMDARNNVNRNRKNGSNTGQAGNVATQYRPGNVGNVGSPKIVKTKGGSMGKSFGPKGSGLGDGSSGDGGDGGSYP